MTRRNPARLASVVLSPMAALTFLAATAGCTVLSEDPDGTSGPVRTESPTLNPGPSPSASSTPTPSPSPDRSDPPSRSPSPEETSEAPETPETPTDPTGPPSPDEPLSLTEALLPAAEMPGFDEEFIWSSGRTRPTEPRRLIGTCHRFSMLSIGATEVAHRSYDPPPNGNAAASELVADFADRKTAWRAYRTVLSWRESCPSQLRAYPRTDVSLLEDVSVERGEAGWWLLKYGPIGDDPDVAAFDAEGVALVGSRVAVVQMVLYGQDYSYEIGQEPMAEAIRRAAARIS